jgi:hypothetical protein
MDQEYLKKLALAIARGVPQTATGFVDLASLPFTMSGLMRPEDAVGSTAYLTEKGLLPPPQTGLLNETAEMVSSAMSPSAALKSGLLGIGSMVAAKSASKAPFVDRFDKIYDSVYETFTAGGNLTAAQTKQAKSILDEGLKNYPQLDQNRQEMIANLAENFGVTKKLTDAQIKAQTQKFIKEGMSPKEAEKKAKSFYKFD